MTVVIEVRAWSFRKLAFDGGTWRTEFVSPLPCPFNYGYVEHTASPDGGGQDMLVLGAALATGSRLDIVPYLSIPFVDGGTDDPKWVARQDGQPPRPWEIFALRGFFWIYTWHKRLRYLLRGELKACLRTRCGSGWSLLDPQRGPG